MIIFFKNPEIIHLCAKAKMLFINFYLEIIHSIEFNIGDCI